MTPSDFDCRTRGARIVGSFVSSFLWLALTALLLFGAIAWVSILLEAQDCDERGGVYVKDYWGGTECVVPKRRERQP